MPYAPASIGPQGLTVPVYSDILPYMLNQYQSIYGQIAYTGSDTSDYQDVSVIALLVADVNNAVQLAYNSRSPMLAVGSALDAIVKPILRLQASASTALLSIIGTSGTVINNGAVRDINGNLWNLPASLTIPSSGTVVATATCSVVGPTQANPNTITQIAFGSSAGWLSATNLNAAVIGSSTETDSALRARYAISVGLPSITTLAGTTAAIAAIPGVTRRNVFENSTGQPDANGTPAHSLTCVVEGGTLTAIANAIYGNRGLGAFTNGNTPNTSGSQSVVVVDPQTQVPFTVGFYTPTYVPIYVAISVHGLNAGFTTSVQTAIQNALVTYLNALQIGEAVTYSVLYAVALSVMPSLNLPLFAIRSLTIGTSSSNLAASDVSMLFYQVAQGLAANVTLTVSST